MKNLLIRIPLKCNLTYMLEQDEDEGPSIHLLSPVMTVRSIYSFVVGAIHVIRTSLVTYFISDDNSIVAVESEPEILLGIEADDLEGNDLLPAAEQQARDCE